MHFCDQRAGGIDNLQIALFGFDSDGRGNAMRAENNPCPFRNLSQFLDKNGARLAKFVNDVAVVNDLFAHINRSPVEIQGYLYDVDRSHHSCAKSARPEEDNLLAGTAVAALRVLKHETAIITSVA